MNEISRNPEEVKERIRNLEKKLESTPDPEILGEAGTLYLLLYDLEEDPDYLERAVNYLREATDRHPSSAKLMANFGLALVERGAPMEAISVLRKALQLPSEEHKPHFTAHYLLGKIYLGMGKLEESLEHLEEAHRMEPKNYDCWIDLAVAYAKIGDVDEAKYQLRRILEEQPDNELARENLQRLKETSL
ncbi:MAG: tetratricopeptide repeat protein [bacterium JZ-2024 1]